MVLNNKYRIIFAVLAGLLLSCGWFDFGSGFFVFTGFIPLLFIEEFLDRNKIEFRSVKFFLYSFLSFIVWNLLNTWWIFNATFIGVMAAIVYNSLIMSVVMWLFHISKRTLGASMGYFCFIIFWLAFEKYYYSAELSWPWLHLGNSFGNDIKLVQWYEYTGVQGGSLWILLINVLLFRSFKVYISNGNVKRTFSTIYIIIVLLLIPIAFSLLKFNLYKETSNPVKVAVLQPNIDPYNETELSNTDMLNIVLNMAVEVADSSIDYILVPEATLQNTIIESNINNNKSILDIRSLLQKYPKLSLITGAYTYKVYHNKMNNSETSSKVDSGKVNYDSFNSAIQINTTDSIQIYHKSKLVLGVEKMPFPKLLKYAEKLIKNLGGTSASLGIQEERGVFSNNFNNTIIAPVICYESVYGEFVNGFILNGANAIAVITNDGWWGNTPGHKQHLSYSRIRAIETRRSIARSASTGISAIINQKGEVLSTTKYGEKAFLTGSINTNNKISFYVKNGDYIGRASIFFSLIMLLYTLMRTIVKDKTE